MKKFFLSVALLSSVVLVNAQNSSPYWSLAGNSNVTGSSKFGTTNNYSLRFYTNNTQRMVINSAAGLVGIGTAAPTEKLHVNSASGANAFRAQVNGNTKLLVHRNGGVSIGANETPESNGLYVKGTVGIGTTTPFAKLAVSNDFSSTGTEIEIEGSGEDIGIHGTSNGIGILGYGSNKYGTYGQSVEGTGALGTSTYGTGVSGYSGTGYAVDGWSDGDAGGNFYGKNGLVATTNGTGGYAGLFNGKVYATNGFTTSDKNLKKDIQEFSDAMSIINKLKPRNYEFKNDEKLASLHLPKGRHYGLIAQDLEQLLPELVSESSHKLRSFKRIAPLPPTADGKTLPVAAPQKETEESIKIKAVNYTELIPIIIKGMQEMNETKDKKIDDLQKQIEKQQQQIDDLKSLVQSIAKQGGTIPSNPRAFIKQNIPNPSNNNTLISYFTPGETKNAQIIVTDMKGSVLKTFTLLKGEGQVNIKRGELPTGSYNYTLYVNNSRIETKQMIIAK
jgi:hypothetical protein